MAAHTRVRLASNDQVGGGAPAAAGDQPIWTPDRSVGRDPADQRDKALDTAPVQFRDVHAHLRDLGVSLVGVTSSMLCVRETWGCC
ncbi:hypothetical protein GCM10009681_12300 [Luedemannella helvata]|uniref:Isochorismatase family protein n=1 Tax=Luedemannella helvata TaxID=349315 RepID=A0ABP4W1X5_9ACTN